MDKAEEQQVYAAGKNSARQLCSPVEWDFPPGEVARHGESQGDGGVYVCAGDVAYGVNHRRYYQAEGKSNTQMGYLSV